MVFIVRLRVGDAWGGPAAAAAPTTIRNNNDNKTIIVIRAGRALMVPHNYNYFHPLHIIILCHLRYYHNNYCIRIKSFSFPYLLSITYNTEYIYIHYNYAPRAGRYDTLIFLWRTRTHRRWSFTAGKWIRTMVKSVCYAPILSCSFIITCIVITRSIINRSSNYLKYLYF